MARPKQPTAAVVARGLKNPTASVASSLPFEARRHARSTTRSDRRGLSSKVARKEPSVTQWGRIRGVERRARAERERERAKEGKRGRAIPCYTQSDTDADTDGHNEESMEGYRKRAVIKPEWTCECAQCDTADY